MNKDKQTDEWRAGAGRCERCGVISDRGPFPRRCNVCGWQIVDQTKDKQTDYLEAVEMGYYAEQRLQITLANGIRPAEKIHEDDGSGAPLCGTPARPLEGLPAIYWAVGPGEVTCLRCDRAKARSSA